MFSPDDFEIIDMHVHPFETVPQRIGCYSQMTAPEEFDGKMHALGIDKYAGSVIEKGDPHDFNLIKHLNRTALRLRDRFPDYIPGIHVHGEFVEESCAELHEMYSHGVRLVGELVPYILGTGGFHSSGMLQIFREMERLGMVANLHWANKEEITAVVEAAPNLPVILAHPGEGPGEWGAMERMKFVNSHSNTYMDISGTGLFRHNFMRYFIDLYGADRILFGSDMPTCSAGMNLYGVLCEDLTKEELQKVFAGNFKRLIGMEQ